MSRLFHLLARMCVVTLLAFGLLGLGFLTPANAHPHVLVTAAGDIVFDGQGRIAAIRYRWTFDEQFSSYAKQGLDKDGKFTREALQPLAEVNVKSLSEFDYFTKIVMAGKRIKNSPPTDYWIDHDDKSGALILNFTLPLSAPVAPGAQGVVVQVADPEYFVAFEMVKSEPVKLIGAPAGCTFSLKGPEQLDDAAVAQLSRLPPTLRQLPSALSGLTQGLTNDILVKCP